MTTSHRRDTFWLGMHKTGTTFLQKSLDLSQSQLIAQGIQYVELSEFRRHYTRPLLYAGSHPYPEIEGPHSLTQTKSHRLVFDENIPSLVQHALSRTGLYPDAAGRARRMADHLGLKVPHLVFGLRDFASFLPSLYCETLKATQFCLFRQFLRTPFTALSWADMIGRVALAFPNSPITVYGAESLRGREAALLSHLTSIPPESITLLRKKERVSFSHQAVNSLHRLAQTRQVTHADVWEQVRLSPRGKHSPAFDPWTEEEKSQLAALYANDMARLADDQRVRVLDLVALSS